MAAGLEVGKVCYDLVKWEEETIQLNSIEMTIFILLIEYDKDRTVNI